MQKMIEQVGSSRQLFETVNFAFMKNFGLLGPACSIIFYILRGAHLQKVKYLKSPSYDF